jgi:hypothetical protein
MAFTKILFEVFINYHLLSTYLIKFKVIRTPSIIIRNIYFIGYSKVFDLIIQDFY